MKRADFKLLVKECLVEILQEGLLPTQDTIRESRRVQDVAKPSLVGKSTLSRPALDLVGIKPGGVQQSKTSALPKQKVQIPTDDPILAVVLADTAATTLLEQSSAEARGGPDIDTGVDPVDIDGASNWAKLAFAERRAT